MKFQEQEVIVYSNQYGYSVRLARKDRNDEWISAFLVTNFKKGVSIPDKSKIKLLDSWLSFYETKDGKKVLLLFVNKFDYII